MGKYLSLSADLRLLKSTNGWNQMVLETPHFLSESLWRLFIWQKLQEAEIAEDIFWALVQKSGQTSSSSGYGL